MAKLFNTFVVDTPEDELKEAYNLYMYHINALNEKPISYKQFLKTPNLNVHVDMKCLNCHFEVREHFGNYAMEMEAMKLPFPIDWCPNCAKQHLVPKDIYNKLLK